MQKVTSVETDYGTDCRNCERYQKLGDVCVVEHGKRFLWEFCKDFVSQVELPDYKELMKTVKKDMALEREKKREKKERERKKKLKERMARKEEKRKKRRARLRRLREKEKKKMLLMGEKGRGRLGRIKKGDSYHPASSDKSSGRVDGDAVPRKVQSKSSS
jgi:ATPase subunit of ABC transporter with duplicated ATPase domains